jgi:hypothetical protein
MVNARNRPNEKDPYFKSKITKGGDKSPFNCAKNAKQGIKCPF